MSMAHAQDKSIKAEAVRKTKVETTYEYVPIIGELLGFWRKTDVGRIGDTVELHIRTHLSNYDRLVINGQEVDTSKLNK